ncbi:MAG: ABC transporter ATP-binding protein [Anaerolineales bacterium]|jgi:putative ABC transport system ATP-binding protein|nr:ABC transporter ATP-binding protein [Anaerolineales bacterium]
MTFALETHDIKKVYSSGNLTVTAVEQVTIGVHPGEFVALVGPSGSGKTSLLAILAGLLAPTAGKVLIDGHDMVKMSDKERTQFRKEKIGFTFQANNLIPYLTAVENVELMLRLNGKNGKQGRKRAQDLLERLGLGERLNNLPGQLSGGQQQRVAIARALVHDPAVVLADEPTASLDTERAFQVVETFASLIHEQNRAGIMVTHDLRMVKYVDTVIQMVDGHVAHIIRDRADIDAMAGHSQYAPPRASRPEPITLPASQPFPAGMPITLPSPMGIGD